MIITIALIWLIAGCLTGWVLGRHYGRQQGPPFTNAPPPATISDEGPRMAPPFWMR